MELNKDILLDCVNHVSGYKFTSIESYLFFSDSILVTVTSYKVDVDFIGRKTVEVYINEYILFERLNKIKKIHTF